MRAIKGHSAPAGLLCALENIHCIPLDREGRSSAPSPVRLTRQYRFLRHSCDRHLRSIARPSGGRNCTSRGYGTRWHKSRAGQGLRVFARTRCEDWFQSASCRVSGAASIGLETTSRDIITRLACGGRKTAKACLRGAI